LWRSLPAPSLAYGSRGSELRGLALLNIASYNTGSLRDMALWNGGMFHRAEEQITRQYEGKRSTWYKGKRMVY
jgi:hypothetical protein